MNPKSKLKKREKEILNFMSDEISKKGYPPTIREICSAIGIKSTSTVHKDIANLEAAGLIVKDPSKPRALMLVDQDSQESSNSSADSIQSYEPSVIEIPVVGHVAAGTPILAEENIEDSFPVPSRYVNGSDTNFMLIIKGESMIEAGIMDGDYVLVQKQNTANNGDIVVAMIDEIESEATVKTFYKEADYIRLQPENSTLDPILVKNPQILGKVKGVFRYF